MGCDCIPCCCLQVNRKGILYWFGRKHNGSLWILTSFSSSHWREVCIRFFFSFSNFHITTLKYYRNIKGNRRGIILEIRAFFTCNCSISICRSYSLFPEIKPEKGNAAAEPIRASHQNLIGKFWPRFYCGKNDVSQKGYLCGFGILFET